MMSEGLDILFRPLCLGLLGIYRAFGYLRKEVCILQSILFLNPLNLTPRGIPKCTAKKKKRKIRKDDLPLPPFSICCRVVYVAQKLHQAPCVHFLNPLAPGDGHSKQV